MLLQVDHVGLNVRSLDESIIFYQEMFGATVIKQWAIPRQAFIRISGMVVGLIESPEFNFRTHTMAHLAFSCTLAEFEEMLVRISERQLEVVSGPKSQRGGASILFRDSSGNILEICYPSIANGESYVE